MIGLALLTKATLLLGLALTATAMLVGALIGDATTAAVVTVIGTLLNSLLIGHNTRETLKTRADTRRIKKIIASPRRITYDANGHPFGTILELDDGDVEALGIPTMQGGRRAADPSKASDA